MRDLERDGAESGPVSSVGGGAPLVAGAAPPVGESSDVAAPRSWLDVLASLGAAGQITVAGLYAWVVTVVPAAWGRGVGVPAKVCAVVAPLVLVAAAVADRRAPRAARLVAVWGFLGACVAAWLFATAALAPARLDAGRGLTGMLGWLLFAYAAAGPALAPRTAPRTDGALLSPRAKLARGDVYYLALGAVLALALQAVGWRTNGPERAVLVRLVLLAAGLAVLGAVMSASLARHARPAAASRRRRLQPTIVWCAALLAALVLGLAGSLLSSRVSPP